MKVWGQNRETILGDKKNIERFYNDLLGLKGAIIDEQLENYNYWATSIGQWYRHIQRGETFDESSKTWIIPEQIKAATGFSTWLDRPTEILLGGMNGTRILAGERRREAFIIAPENSIVPVTSQVNLSQTPGKKITIKEINYSPQIIVQGAANQNIGKEEMKNMIHAILKDNYRGFVDYLAEKLKKEFK
jgi:hypothetical protein